MKQRVSFCAITGLIVNVLLVRLITMTFHFNYIFILQLVAMANKKENQCFYLLFP